MENAVLLFTMLSLLCLIVYNACNYVYMLSESRYVLLVCIRVVEQML
jgi:hypothetical protein